MGQLTNGHVLLFFVEYNIAQFEEVACLLNIYMNR